MARAEYSWRAVDPITGPCRGSCPVRAGRRARARRGRAHAEQTAAPVVGARVESRAAAASWSCVAGLLVSVGAVMALSVWLVPPGSYPVGYDVFRSLRIARSWATAGFPSTLPDAAFTGLDDHFADQQLGFDALLTVCCGADIDGRCVPALVWMLVVAQALMIWIAARWLRPGVTPAWLLLLPSLSQAWLFRSTALRTMLLCAGFVILLLGVAALRARGRGRAAWLAVPAAAFAYCHGAVVLPLVLWCVAALGTRLDRGAGRLPWRDGAWVLGG